MFFCGVAGCEVGLWASKRELCFCVNPRRPETFPAKSCQTPRLAHPSGWNQT